MLLLLHNIILYVMCLLFLGGWLVRDGKRLRHDVGQELAIRLRVCHLHHIFVVTLVLKSSEQWVVFIRRQEVSSSRFC